MEEDHLPVNPYWNFFIFFFFRFSGGLFGFQESGVKCRRFGSVRYLLETYVP